MNQTLDTKEKDRLAAARECFSAKLLTDPQFEEVLAIVGIIGREIRKTGAFKGKLGDYAYAFSRTEKMDVARAETIIRDVFKAYTGMSMNAMRQMLADREDKLTEEQKSGAYEYALEVGRMIEDGDKMSFNRAFAFQGQGLARDIGITDAAARRLMKEAFKATEGSEFYDWGKALEEQFYRPQVEADKHRRDSGDATPEEEREPSPANRTDVAGGSDRRRQFQSRAQTGAQKRQPTP